MAEKTDKQVLDVIAELTRMGTIVWRPGEHSNAEADWNGGKLIVGRGQLQDDITFERRMTLTEELAVAIKSGVHAARPEPKAEDEVRGFPCRLHRTPVPSCPHCVEWEEAKGKVTESGEAAGQQERHCK